MPRDPYKAIEHHLTAWLATVKRWEASRQALRRELSQLQRRGLTPAKPHWRDGKYLYLVHPVADTKRKREYIGRDPQQVQAALARVERTQLYQTKHAELEKTEQALERLLNELERLAFLNL